MFLKCVETRELSVVRNIFRWSAETGLREELLQTDWNDVRSRDWEMSLLSVTGIISYHFYQGVIMVESVYNNS